MDKIGIVLLLALSLCSCAEHPYETDGHNSVQLPDAIDEEPNVTKDSLTFESEY